MNISYQLTQSIEKKHRLTPPPPPPPRSTTPGRSNKFDSPFQISDTPSYRRIRGSVNHNYLKFPLIKDMQNLKVVSKSRTTHIKGY